MSYYAGPNKSRVYTKETLEYCANWYREQLKTDLYKDERIFYTKSLEQTLKDIENIDQNTADSDEFLTIL